jgi:hypothetical protein
MGYVACMKIIRNAYKILVGKPEKKRILARTRCTWEDILKLILKNYVWGCGLDSCGSD